jgi:hypothetical protein
VIIFIVLFIVWIWSRFNGEVPTESESQSLDASRSRTKAQSRTKSRSKPRAESLVPIVSSLSSTFSNSKPVELSDEVILRQDSLEQASVKLGKCKKQSVGEAECLRVLEKLRARKARVQVRNLNVLKNRVTQRNLELDIYFENDLNLEGYKHLACEYNGRQHYELVPFFHKKGEEAFLYQQWKDAEKADMCDNAGIYLITVPDTVPFKEIEDFIIWNLPENAYRRLHNTSRR